MLVSPPCSLQRRCIALLALCGMLFVASDAWPKSSRWWLFPNLLDSTVQGFDSDMLSSPVERFESQLMNSPAQPIGSPFAPYRFATLPNTVEVYTGRQSLGWLPAMLQTPQGTLLLLPPYTLPQSLWLELGISPFAEAETPLAIPAKVIPRPKFISLRCGRFVEIKIPASGTLQDWEEQPCE